MKTKLTKSWLIPPPEHLCQTCATKHTPEQPHNPQSLYYQYLFELEQGRLATWRDAMSHCSEEMKNHWIKYLDLLGIDIDSQNLTGNIQSAKDLVNRLKKKDEATEINE